MTEGETASPGATHTGRPYVGLSYYTEADARLFFGRDSERKKIIGNLRAARLTVLYAQSGVGKSSLLRAGVAPRIRELAAQTASGRRPLRYVPVVFSSWDDDPLEQLLAQIDASIEPFLAEGAQLALAGGRLDEAIARAAAAVDATLLIICDQFEDYLLYRTRGVSEEPLADELARCINRPDIRANFLIAIREDAYAGLGDLFQGRIANVYGNFLHLEHLERAAAREAIQRPVEQFNDEHDGEQPVVIEPELVDAVLDQVQTGEVMLEPAGRGRLDRAVGRDTDAIETPYLQLVMTRLWDEEMRSGSRALRLSTLTRLGGAQEIVKTHLDTALRALGEDDRDSAADVFHHLVTPSGTKIAHDATSLAEYTQRSETEVEALLEMLARSDTRIVRRLPPPPGRAGAPRFEVFHDVLAAAILDWRTRHRLERDRRRLEARSRRLTTALVGAIAIVIALMVYIFQPAPLQRLELKTVDARFALRGSSPPSNLLIVGIDAPTLAALASTQDHLIPRTDQAKVIDQIWSGRPAVIAEDVIYGTSRPGDSAMFSAMERASGHVVLAASRLNADADTTLFGRDPAVTEGGRAFVQKLGAEPGYVGVVPDRDQRIRHFQSAVGLNVPGASRMSTLPVVTARVAGKRVGDFGSTWIDYRGPAGTIPRVSFLDVFSGKVDPQRFHNKVVLVGSTAAGRDIHPSPAGGGSNMPGVEILANATSTSLRGLPLHGARGVDIALIVLLGLLPMAALRLRTVGTLLACLCAAIAFLVAVQLAFDSDVMAPVVYPMLALALSAVAVLGAQVVLNRHLLAQRHRR